MAARLQFCTAVVLAMLAGCSRSHYQHRADVDAYSLLREKAERTPWEMPFDYDIVAIPGSRLHDPTPLQDPLLPHPSPQLYAYDLPQLRERDPSRFQQRLQGQTLETAAPSPEVQVASHAVIVMAVSDDSQTSLPELPEPEEAESTELQENEIRLTPVPPSAWKEIPSSCKIRMFEFASIRKEYEVTFGQPPSDTDSGDTQSLALEDIIELALLNSREYQTQKETLYRTALRLSLRRFDYDLKFTTNGNRIATDYTHARDAGITVNRLRVPSGYQVDKMLSTGGTVLARFANNLVLTFNGTNGFATDIGSDIVLDIEQTLLQIDVQFEPLTQAERNVVYAARNFARFRKTFYTTLTSRYYTLIRTYRQVEIDSQNYITLARAFRQAEEEYRARQVPRFQVDQVEQNVLTGRRRLIETCNNLEQALDNLKIRIGLPTETPIDIDLTELEQLTRHDELAVRRELVRRVQKRLLAERHAAAPERVVLLSAAVDLIDRLLGAFDVLTQLGEEAPNDKQLRKLRSRLGMQQSRSDADFVRRELERELQGNSPNYAKLFGRSIDLCERLLNLIDYQIELATLQTRSAEAIADMRQAATRLRDRTNYLSQEDDRIVEQFEKRSDGSGEEFDDEQFLAALRRLVDDVSELRVGCEDLVQQLEQLTDHTSTHSEAAEKLQESLQTIDGLLTQTDQLLSTIGGGLATIEIETDDAMLTALVMRFELMNERGALADDWRQIKLAADDLKSVLNLRATQTVRSPGASPFDFTFDESLTRLNATLDLPLNRRNQRNTFRESLINYQVALRGLMQLEDNIKLEVRNGLRSLALDQEQYQVDVASAGLAFERVVSTQIEQRLGIGGVTARDFLEAQDAYISALSRVASRHISFVVNRMELFLAMEVLAVNEQGMWDGLYNESIQPTPYYQLPPEAFPFYGELPHGLHFSRDMRRMEQVPPGTSMIHRAPTVDELQPIPEEIDAPDAQTP